MNGELYQICCIAAAAREALSSGKAAEYVPFKYENEPQFELIPKAGLFGIKRSVVARGTAEWYKCCLERGLSEVKMLLPVSVKDRQILGFSNTAASSLVCFYSGGTVTYFVPKWTFDQKHKMWDTLYKEFSWNDPPQGKPQFEDNTAQFLDVLKNIASLAEKIDCECFAAIFRKAADIITGAQDADSMLTKPLSMLSGEKLRLFSAASTADVFGAMGSWNDSPPYMAAEKGLSDEYETLSSELLTQIRKAILYSINE